MSRTVYYRSLTLIIDDINRTLDVRFRNCETTEDLEKIIGENQEGLKLYRQLLGEGYQDLTEPVTPEVSSLTSGFM